MFSGETPVIVRRERNRRLRIRKNRGKTVIFHKDAYGILSIYPEIKYVSKLDRHTPDQYNEANY